MTARSMGRSKVVVAAIVMSIFGFICQANGQEFVIGIVDFYGLRQISESRAREALTFRVAILVASLCMWGWKSAVRPRCGFAPSRRARRAWRMTSCGRVKSFRPP